MRSRKSVLRKIAESLGFVLVAQYKNRPNMVLAKHEVAITFALAIRTGHIVYGFGVEK